MSLKYVLCPGVTISQETNRRVYIGPQKLAKLYGVDESECAIYDPTPDWTALYYRRAEQQYKDLIPLKPQPNGKYILK